jgi:hypothetical protein
MQLKQLVRSIIPGPVKGIVRHTREKYQDVLSKYYYGNTLPYQDNVKGSRNWSNARRAFLEPYDRELHEEFRKIGYANLSAGADMATIQSLRRTYEKAIGDPQHSVNPFTDPVLLKAYNHGGYQGPLGEYRRQIIDTPSVFPNYGGLFNDKLIYLIQSCLGSHFSVFTFDANRNIHVPEHIFQHFEPHSNRWHFDHCRADNIAMFVYLSDVTSDHGPFECFDRSYSRFLVRKGYSKEGRSRSVNSGMPTKLLDPSRRKAHTGPAGTIVLCATSFCLHRANNPGQGNQRDVLAFLLCPSMATLPMGPPIKRNY